MTVTVRRPTRELSLNLKTDEEGTSTVVILSDSGEDFTELAGAALTDVLPISTSAQEDLDSLQSDLDDLTTTVGTKEPAQASAAAAPTSGAHTRGERVWNSTPSAEGYVGWVCVSSGTPGTWKGFGAIAA